MSDIHEELRPIFFPRSAAVVGVSQDTWKPGSSMLRALMRFGFEGPLYPVSARGGTLMGLEVYPSVQSLPEAVDVAFLFVPTQSLVDVVRQCKQRGVRGIVAFTGGFSETGTAEGRALEEELKKEFDGSFRMIGPNCLGVYSPGGGVTQHPGESYSRRSGDVAFIAQSGGLSEDFARAAPNFGFYCSKVVSYGNACDVNEADLLEYAGLDPATNVVGMYIEGPRDGRRFANVLRDVASRKPVVVWKGGVTPLGAAAASSHTGSLAGSVEVWSALLKQVGAIQVGSFEESLDTLAAFHFLPGLSDTRIGYVGAGGGNTVVAGDASYRAGLPLAAHERRDAAEDGGLPAPCRCRAPPIPSTCSRRCRRPRNSKAFWKPWPARERSAPSSSTGSSFPRSCAASCTTPTRPPVEDEPWLSDIPIDIHRSTGVRGGGGAQGVPRPERRLQRRGRTPAIARVLPEQRPGRLPHGRARLPGPGARHRAQPERRCIVSATAGMDADATGRVARR